MRGPFGGCLFPSEVNNQKEEEEDKNKRMKRKREREREDDLEMNPFVKVVVTCVWLKREIKVNFSLIFIFLVTTGRETANKKQKTKT